MCSDFSGIDLIRVLVVVQIFPRLPDIAVEGRPRKATMAHLTEIPRLLAAADTMVDPQLGAAIAAPAGGEGVPAGTDLGLVGAARASHLPSSRGGGMSVGYTTQGTGAR